MATVEDRAAHEAFFVFRKGEEEGPFSFRELDEMHEGGQISPATPCRSRAAKEWHDLAFILREGEPSQIDEPAEFSNRISAPAKEENLKTLVADLVDSARRQNRLLNSIKWILVVLILMTGGVILALQ